MTVLVSDSFNRTDSTTTLGTTDSYNGGTGQLWTAVTGTWGISSNQAYNVNRTADGIAVVDSGQSDVTVTVTDAVNVAGAQGDGIYFRFLDVNNWWRIVKGTGQLYLQKRVSGSNTTLLNPTGLTFAANDIISVTAQGNSITIYLNGVSKGSVTDTFNQTATKHGIGNQALTGTGYRFDNFQIDSLTTGGTDATITAVAATATSSAIAPTVTAQKNATITSVIASSVADGIAPTVSAQKQVVISSIAAASTAAALPPSISTSANVTSIAANALASANAPVVGQVTIVSAVVATANAQSLAPNVTTQQQAVIVSIAANCIAIALAPKFLWQTVVHISTSWQQDGSQPTTWSGESTPSTNWT